MGYPEAQYAVDELASGIVPIVKSVQRGVTTAAGTIKIGEVDIGKCDLTSISKGSAGTVAARGTVSIAKAAVSGSLTVPTTGNYGDYHTGRTNASFSGNVNAHTGTLSGGETDLTVKLYSAVLVDSTTIECDGPVEWQLVEYY